MRSISDGFHNGDSLAFHAAAIYLSASQIWSGVGVKLGDLPSVSLVLGTLDWAKIQLPRVYVRDIIRKELVNYRQRVAEGGSELTADMIVEQVVETVMAMNLPGLRQVVNGTGIVLHTGLGRAPFSRPVLRSVMSQMEGYTALELSLVSGKRGERTVHVSSLLCSLTGAQSSLIVNNNAAAVLLALNTLADGKEVIVSRGQLVEIGGSFRMPDVIKKSGATLVEVGTTNRTHFEDYEKAIGGNTGVILFVHTSNYRVTGFTMEVPLFKLSELCRRRKLPLVTDLGSGALFDLETVDLPHELQVSEVLKQGADVVTFSGDKLLGGPQGGLICGKKHLVSRLHRNPLYRAVRCGKMTLSLMEQSLRTYRGRTPEKDNLTFFLLTTSQKTLLRRGERLIGALPGKVVQQLGLKIVPSKAEAGSGSLPTEQIESAAVQFASGLLKPTELARKFREWNPPILGYISGRKFHIDLKAVLTEQYDVLAAAFREIAESSQ